jgi:phage tail sheath protein FI
MAVTVSYPGVYIDEFEPAAPIQGVGTSTAAFLGSCPYGPPMTPTLVTSWDGFLAAFPWPADGPADNDYLWYAVRGFFANGGKVCFVTAVSNATPDSGRLPDEAGKSTIIATARRTGHSSPSIQLTGAAAHTVSGTGATGAALFAPSVAVTSATHGTKTIDVGVAATAAQFLAGDAVVIGDTNNTETAVVARVAGTIVYVNDPLGSDYTNATLKLAPLVAFAQTFRVVNAGALGPGSIVTLSQDPGGGAPVVTQTTIVTAVRAERLSAAQTTYRITVKDGVDGFTLYKSPITLQSEEFNLTVAQGGTSQTYNGLSMNPAHPRYFASIINNDPKGLVSLQPDPANTTALPGNRPAGTAPPLAGGTDYDRTLIAGRTSDYDDALKLLEPNKDINMVVAADRTDPGVQSAVLDHCSRLYDRFAIFDAVEGASLTNVEDQRNGLENDKGFGALYYPWLQVVSQKTGQTIVVPPGGYVAGIYARTDLSRGVFKAPAGTQAIVNGALGVDQPLSDTSQGIVNLKGINVIRVFQHGGRPVVWGARTTCADTNWQYVNIRRLFLFLEQSIQQGIRGSVFEPNNTALWQRLKRTITAFLTQQWRDGALFGAKVEEAFYVRIDDVLNPDSERQLGRLTIEIGVRPAYPAEFIIVRIGIWQGGSDVSEG